MDLSWFNMLVVITNFLIFDTATTRLQSSSLKITLSRVKSDLG